MTGPQVVTRPGGGVVLRVRAGPGRPDDVDLTEVERVQLALLDIRRETQRITRATVAQFRADIEIVLRTHLPVSTKLLTPRAARHLMARIRRAFQELERRLLLRSQQGVTGVLQAQRAHFPDLPARFEAGIRAAIRVGRNPLRKSLALVIDPTRAEIQEYIRAVTGREPTDVAVRAIERMVRGELPVEIGGVSAAAGTQHRARRLIASEALNAMREGNSAALKTLPGLLARWTTSGLPTVCPRCLALSTLDIGFGPGLFPPQLWPRAVHPFCACYQSGLREMTPAEEKILARLLADGVTVYSLLGWDEKGRERRRKSPPPLRESG